LFGGAGFMAQQHSSSPPIAILWASAAVFAPLAILAALYYRIAGFERSIPFAGLALVLAALFALATEALTRRPTQPASAAAQAIFATGAVAALALAFTLALEKGWLTIGLALMVPGITWILSARPLPMLRWLAGILVALVFARIAWEPRIVGDAIGATPISTGCSTATASRHWRSGLPARSSAAVPTTSQRGLSTPARSCSRCCWCLRRSVTLLMAATSTRRTAA
jgi:uncharacterized membrane protein